MVTLRYESIMLIKTDIFIKSMITIIRLSNNYMSRYGISITYITSN